MATQFIAMPPADAKPASLRPTCLGKLATAALVEKDLRDAVSTVLQWQSSGKESQMSAKEESLSQMSTQPPSESPSRRGSIASFSMEDIVEENMSLTSPSPFPCCLESFPGEPGTLHCAVDTQSQSSQSLAGSSTRSSPQWGSTKSSPKTPTRLRERVKAAQEEAPVRPWLGLRDGCSVDKSTGMHRNVRMSLPCVEVGYWSVFDLGRTATGSLATPRQEDLRRTARDNMLRATRAPSKTSKLGRIKTFLYTLHVHESSGPV